MSDIKSSDIDAFCRSMKVDSKTKIDISLMIELLDRFADEQVKKRYPVVACSNLKGENCSFYNGGQSKCLDILTGNCKHHNR